MADQDQNEQVPQGMAQHHAFVTINASIHQVYSMFTHFADFPQFMHFVKDVNYIDNDHTRTHWVADVIGQHEWDAIDENWVPDRQVGWRSYSGLQNEGKVTFQPAGVDQTQVDVYIDYNPPLGVLGDIGEKLGAGSRFEHDLQRDLENFARMVEDAPPSALNPDSSSYLFHQGSAAADEGKTPSQTNQASQVNQQNATNQPNMVSPGTGVKQPSTTEQTMMGQPQEGYLTGQPIEGNAVVEEVYEIDTLPPELEEDNIAGQPVMGDDVVVEVYEIDTLPSGQGVPMMEDDNVGVPPPNPTNIYMPPEGTVRPVMPDESGVNNPVMPPAGGRPNLVTPPEGSSGNPVMPPEGGARNPVMPPDNGVTNPVMPPERQDNG